MTQFWTNLRYKAVYHRFGQRYFLFTLLNKETCKIRDLFSPSKFLRVSAT
jgi:hypothetical protein